jgi:hypothetical protein
MRRPAGAALPLLSNDGRIFLFWTVLESKMTSVICALAPFPEQLLHLCANRIKLFVSRAVGFLQWSFSTNFSTQLLKSQRGFDHVYAGC